jgi:lipoyl(octanoyl) transferase
LNEPNITHRIETQRTCWVVDLTGDLTGDAGVIAYADAWELQRRVVQARKAGAIPDVLLICEHPHVITLGRNGKQEHLRASDHVLRQMRVEFHATDRGGDITYHGPGQIVGYPIIDLTGHRRDVRWYVEQLEEAMIGATASFSIVGKRSKGAHGVWVDTPRGEEKLAAVGVHISRWVTSHGFAYNVSTDLRYFELIVPCGIADKRATSLESLLDRTVSRSEALTPLVQQFGNVFQLATVSISRAELDKALADFLVETNPPAQTPTVQASPAYETIAKKSVAHEIGMQAFSVEENLAGDVR